ncbi:MAG: ATP-binding protein [Pseudobdellovibrionaceae bacterium]|nr:MAG: ATP-binding protein [Pseudobdellovibrionaceae bacterium]
MMYARDISKNFIAALEKYPVVVLMGPRQSGKTTLSRALFPEFNYVSLEQPDIRKIALEDPLAFFKNHHGNLIIDEVQRVPELLSYIQGIIDEPNCTQKFILTGSQQFLLMEKVAQTLAGRTRILKLLPLSWSEYAHDAELEEVIVQGGYPRIHDKNLNPGEWHSQYFQTYVERDVREVLQIGDLVAFERFIRLCAGRVGQLINYESLGNDAGVTQPTAKSWLSTLNVSFITTFLPPHFKNFSKRIIKTPKLYFYDTGLLCWLLNIKNANDLKSHPLRGPIFENWVVSEYLKHYYNRGEEPSLYFWRSQKGKEVDLIIDRGSKLFPIEIKSGVTFQSEWIKAIDYFNDLQSAENLPSACVYGGNKNQIFKNTQVLSWKQPIADLPE